MTRRKRWRSIVEVGWPNTRPIRAAASFDRGDLASVRRAAQWLETYHWTLSLGLSDQNARLAAAEAFDKARPARPIPPRSATPLRLTWV